MLTLAAIVVATLAQVSSDKLTMQPESLYNGLNRPVMIEITGSNESNKLELVLMDSTGQVLAGPKPIKKGRRDLAEEIPDIWQLRKACYLQLLDGGEATGPSLVLQPLLNRPPMWTKREFRPGGETRYTRIIGWGNEPPEEWTSAYANKNTNTKDETNTPQDEDPHNYDDAPEKEEEAFSGFRIYQENDVVIETTLGDITITLRPDEAPNTAWNFRHLTEGGFYKNVVFHRIVPYTSNGVPFVIQAGDPGATGSGGPGYWLPLEPSRLPHDFGVISMARADDPDSAGSQFFICLSREGTARLDGQYCAFGYAVNGASVIQGIAAVELADVAAGIPRTPPIILNARLIPSPPRIPEIGRPDRKVALEDTTEKTEKSERVGR